MMAGLRKRLLISSSAVLALLVTAGTVSADQPDFRAKITFGGGDTRYSENVRHYESDEYSQAPVRVFVRLGEKDRGYKGRRGWGKGRKHNRDEAIILASLAKHLPYGIELVSNRFDADITVRLRQSHYDLNFHVIERDRESKKYRKRDRFGFGRCGYAKRAFYNEITERGVARYGYDLAIRVKGSGRYHDSLYGQAVEKFRYATDLYAASNCGPVPTERVPSAKVAKLLYQASPEYRRTVAREIRKESLYETGASLAALIIHKVERLSSPYELPYDNYQGD